MSLKKKETGDGSFLCFALFSPGTNLKLCFLKDGETSNLQVEEENKKAGPVTHQEQKSELLAGKISRQEDVYIHWTRRWNHNAIGNENCRVATRRLTTALPLEDTRNLLFSFLLSHVRFVVINTRLGLICHFLCLILTKNSWNEAPLAYFWQNTVFRDE